MGTVQTANSIWLDLDDRVCVLEFPISWWENRKNTKLGRNRKEEIERCGEFDRDKWSGLICPRYCSSRE